MKTMNTVHASRIYSHENSTYSTEFAVALAPYKINPSSPNTAAITKMKDNASLLVCRKFDSLCESTCNCCITTNGHETYP